MVCKAMMLLNQALRIFLSPYFSGIDAGVLLICFFQSGMLPTQIKLQTLLLPSPLEKEEIPKAPFFWA